MGLKKLAAVSYLKKKTKQQLKFISQLHQKLLFFFVYVLLIGSHSTFFVLPFRNVIIKHKSEAWKCTLLLQML